MEHERNGGRPGDRCFRIWVQGRLEEGFSEGLAGIEQNDVPSGTMLSGALLDQSHLHSTLDLLRDLGIDVLRFEVDPSQPPTSTDCSEHVEARGGAMRDRHPHEPTKRSSGRDVDHDQEKGR